MKIGATDYHFSSVVVHLNQTVVFVLEVTQVNVLDNNQLQKLLTLRVRVGGTVSIV